MYEIESEGILKVTQQALSYLEIEKGYPLLINFDLDSVDPRHAPGTSHKCRGGLSYRETKSIIRKAQQTGNLVSLDVMEYDPIFDTDRGHYQGDIENIERTVGKTGYLAVEMMLTALGYTDI